ncbi:glycosyltransferase [uncultured Desulfosarcina sp.]|uniref:glycosyltransferase n=1 Tax=uncultured Desulfosarcina sp. TaxID=218289 RepID=UPI0029C62527|nr:glycosyltransferase [uncultured Desulfosarcina sp.]
MNIGGPAIHVKNLSEGLDRDRYVHKLVTGSISSNEGDMSYILNFSDEQIIVIPSLQRELSVKKDLVALLNIFLLIRQFKPDIIHSHTSKAGAISRIAAISLNFFSRKKILIVHTFHGNVLEGYFSTIKSFVFLMIERFLAKFSDRIIAISESQRQDLNKVYQIGTPEKIEVIKLGFDLNRFVQCDESKGLFRKKHDLNEKTILIGIVGRLVPIKNHKMFLDAGKQLIGNNHDRNLRFVLIGDGEDRQYLERYTHDIGLTNYVIFCGWESDMPMVYADIDILALTSLNEGTPVSIVEAMAASVPVISTDVGGIKDLLGEEIPNRIENQGFKICERGVLCPKDDPESFTDALYDMLTSEAWKDEGRLDRARDYVLIHYSMERLLSDVESLYEKLMEPKKNSG